MPPPFKSEDLLIAGLGATLLTLALMSFFLKPAYEPAASHIIDGLLTALSTVIGFKFGRSMPQQASDPKPGQAAETTTTTTTAVKG